MAALSVHPAATGRAMSRSARRVELAAAEIHRRRPAVRADLLGGIARRAPRDRRPRRRRCGRAWTGRGDRPRATSPTSARRPAACRPAPAARARGSSDTPWNVTGLPASDPARIGTPGANRPRGLLAAIPANACAIRVAVSPSLSIGASGDFGSSKRLQDRRHARDGGRQRRRRRRPAASTRSRARRSSA